MANNIYSEMLESLKIPDRLSPENIAAMLDTKACERNNRAKISLSSAPDNITDESLGKKHITVSESKKSRSIGLAYRTVASLAACAVMALGLVRYFDVGEIKTVDSDIKGSTFASNYDELHKTFRKYYVDDVDKKTLDSVVEEIAPSYNDAPSDETLVNVPTESDAPTIPAETIKPDDAPAPSQPVADDPVPDNQDTPALPPEDSNPGANTNIRIPEMEIAENKESILVGDGKIFIRDGSTVKVVLANGGKMEYIGDAVPEYGLFETKTLEEIYTVDSRLIAVYSVVKEEPASVPAASDQSLTVVGEVINNMYTDTSMSVKTNSVEIVVYDIYPNGLISSASVISFKGTLNHSKLKNGYVYVVTNYNNYRRSPLIGVEDLDGYVPSYTVNGEKLYVEPENILIPEYVATTDYTVISGIAAALPNVPVSVQAVLGTEDKVLATDDAVYVFGYSNTAGTEDTTIDKFSLNYGRAHFDGSAMVEGVAVKNGMSSDNSIIIVTTLKNTDSGYVTSANVLDSNMNLISKAGFAAALKNVSFNQRKVYLSNGTDSYAVDFSAPASPVEIEYQDDIDVTSGLVPFGNGYCTLTKEGDDIILAKLARREAGELYVECETVINSNGGTSKALKNNSLMYCDGTNGYIGVPYGYYDGFDYCYKYVLYKLEPQGFVEVGAIESHEVEDSFEMGKSILKDGVLYIFSDGRIYSAAVGENALSVLGSVDLIESSYSGHTSW